MIWFSLFVDIICSAWVFPAMVISDARNRIVNSSVVLIGFPFILPYHVKY